MTTVGVTTMARVRAQNEIGSYVHVIANVLNADRIRHILTWAPTIWTHVGMEDGLYKPNNV